MSGSAKCCSSFPLFHRMIKQRINTIVPLSLFLRNIREDDAQVAYIFLLKCVFYIFCIILPPGWIDRVNSAMVYERKSNKQVLYVLPSHPSCPSSHWFQWRTLDSEPSLSACWERLQTLAVGPVTRSLGRVMGAFGGIMMM